MSALATARHTRGHHARARVERIVTLLLAGRSLKEICAEAPVSRSSLHRIRRSAEFEQLFNETKRQAFESAVNCLHDSALTFVKTLKGVCLDEKARGSEKATAARSGLDSLFKATELFDIETRLRKLEAVAGEGQK